MIYGYKRPTAVWSVAGANSPAFETDIRLGNSQPSEQTVISAIASAAPTVAEYVDITCDWATPQPLGLVGLLNTSAPAGTKLLIEGRKLGDGGYGRNLGANSASQTVTTLPDGRRQAIILCDLPDDDFIGVRVRIYNDAVGVTWADDTTDLYVGEIAPYAAVHLCASVSRTRSRSTRSTRERASNAALHIAARGEYRSGSYTVLGTIAEAYTQGLAHDMDFARLQALQDGSLYRALVVPRGLSDYGTATDYDLIQQTTLFCAVSWGAMQEEEGMFRASAPLEIEEAP